MSPDPTRVAHRYLTGGVLQAPPAMIKDISKWVMGVMAAQEMDRLQDRLDSARKSDKQMADRRRTVESAITALQAAPTDWKTYKAFYEAAGYFRVMGKRWSIRDFQKMTPEKREDLERRIERVVEAVRRDIGKFEHNAVGKIKKDMADFKPFLVSGVGADDDQRTFDIDADGWRYWGEAVEEKLHENVRDHASREVEKLTNWAEKSPEMAAYLQEKIEEAAEQAASGDPSWKKIHVHLQRESGESFAGYWQRLRNRLVIVVPDTFHEHYRTNVLNTVRHELQHFAQDYLAYIAGKGMDILKQVKFGLPSKSIQTPEYEQWMGRSHPRFDPDKAEVREVHRKLKQQGVDPRKFDFHSLDDVEFYTKLADSIARLRDLTDDMDAEEKREAIKVFVGNKGDGPVWLRPSRFFRTLKRHARGKWKKAVKELVKALT